MELEIDIEEPWPPGDWEVLAERAAAALTDSVPELGNARLSASLLFTSDADGVAIERVLHGARRIEDLL